MIRDLNGWVGDRLRASITGGFEVPGENDMGRSEIGFCAEMRLSLINSYFG